MTERTRNANYTLARNGKVSETKKQLSKSRRSELSSVGGCILSLASKERSRKVIVRALFRRMKSLPFVANDEIGYRWGRTDG
jgi:hypothetical protein